MCDMAEKKTERSNCRFTVERASDGKPILVVELFQDTIPMLRQVLIGFDLLGGMRIEDGQETRRDAQRARPRPLRES